MKNLSKTLELLEYPLVLEKIAEYAQFPLSRERIDGLKPEFKRLWIERENKRCQEAMDLVRLFGAASMSSLKDIRMALTEAGKGMTLSVEDLVDIGISERVFEGVKRYYDNAEIPLDDLADLFVSIVAYPPLAQRIEQSFSANYEVLDTASSNLKRIRQAIRKSLADREQSVQRYIQQHAASLTDTISTLRNGRVVVLAKQSDKNKLGGLIHGESSSGLSVYLEPPQLLSMNNAIQGLYEEEEIEIKRICKEISGEVKEMADDFNRNLETLILLDTYFARAQFGHEFQGCIAKLSDRFELVLKDARHPLIDPEQVIANTYRLAEDKHVLMISGPNTGGKTVSLKIIGLFVLLAYTGIPCPCLEAELPFFDAVYADIGDDQSIVQSLSTFSAHLSKLSQILDEATDSSLILLDELGGGTDPREGESLAMAVLNYLRELKAKTVLTTHYSKLKEYAFEHDDIQIASVEFNMDAMVPSYRYLEGIAGQSYAFEIAARYHLKDEILHEAKALKEAHQSEQAKLQEQLERELKIAQEKQEAFERELKELNHQINAFRLEKEQFEQTKEARMLAYQKELDQKVEAYLEEAEALMEELKASEKEHERLLIKQRLNKGQIRPAVKAALKSVEVGDWVKLRQTGQNAEVTAIKKDKVQLNVNGLKMEVRLNQLEQGEKPRKQEKVRIQSTLVPTVSMEVNLIGMRVEEAISELDHYLDNCLQAKMPFARIIHGHGTGALRQAVHQRLAKHHRVDSYRLGEQGEGGVGATVVQFKK